MTIDTEGPSADERAARLAALRQRRGGRAEPGLRPDSQAPIPSRAPSRRRGHAATGARILTGGLSAGVALALMGVMAESTFDSGAPAAPAPPDVAAAPVVIVVRHGSGPALGSQVTAVAAAPAVAPTAAPPVALSRGS